MANVDINSLDWTPVVSKTGNVLASAYKDGKCFVKFQGNNIYWSDKVPAALYTEFQATHGSADSSTGSFFHQKLKPLSFTKL